MFQVLGDSGAMDSLKANMEEKFMANNPSKVYSFFSTSRLTSFLLYNKHLFYTEQTEI